MNLSPLRRAVAAAILAVLLAAANAGPGSAQTAIHGADSLYVSPTVKLAWAVLKGGSDETTQVILRIVNPADTYRFVRADGVDPFTKQRATFSEPRPLHDRFDIAIPRARFADHPSLELLLDANAEALVPGRAALTIYYLGVPDTTPEFLTAKDADAYLNRMLVVAK